MLRPTKKASEGGGIVWCHDGGHACLAVALGESDSRSAGTRGAYFAKVREGSRFHDAAFDRLSDELNGLIADCHAREQTKRAGLQIGLLLTGAGYLPVWKRDVSAAERLSDLVDVRTLTDLDAMSRDQLSAYLDIDVEPSAAGEWRRPVVVRPPDEGDEYIDCRFAGGHCFVTAAAMGATRGGGSGAGGFFPQTRKSSRVHDPALNQLASSLDSAIAAVERGGRSGGTGGKDDPRRVGLTITGRGLLPVWKALGQTGERPTGEAAGAGSTVDLDEMTADELDDFLDVLR